MLEFFKNWISAVWTEIKQGNPLQAFKAFFGFSTKTSHVSAEPVELKLPRVTTPALKEETIMEVQAGIAASKEAMKSKQKAAIAKRKATVWKPGLETITQETKRGVGSENSAARELEHKAKTKLSRTTEVIAQLAASIAPTIPKTKEEQSKEDKAKVAARKKELQERSKAAVQAKKKSEEKPTTGRIPQLTQGEEQNVAKMLPLLAMMSLATTGDQVKPAKEVKKSKVAKPKREGHATKEMHRRNKTQSKGR